MSLLSKQLVELPQKHSQSTILSNSHGFVDDALAGLPTTGRRLGAVAASTTRPATHDTFKSALPLLWASCRHCAKPLVSRSAFSRVLSCSRYVYEMLFLFCTLHFINYFVGFHFLFVIILATHYSVRLYFIFEIVLYSLLCRVTLHFRNALSICDNSRYALLCRAVLYIRDSSLRTTLSGYTTFSKCPLYSG